MTANIFILNDRSYDTAISFLEPALRTLFKKTVSIQTVDKESLSHPAIWTPEKNFLFIVPPIMGEVCNYNDIFTKNIYHRERHFTEQGGISWRICAGAYHAFEAMNYTSQSSGETTEQRSSTPHISGRAVGPVNGFGREIDPNNEHSDCIVVPVESEINGKHIIFGSCYGNGCSFEVLDPQTKVLARYTHDEERLPAIVEHQIEKGLVIASGIVPHYKYEPETIQPLAKLNQALQPHEPMRLHFMQALLGRMAIHAVRSGYITENDLTIPMNQVPAFQN